MEFAENDERQAMKRMFSRVRALPRPGVVLGVIALVLALGGTSMAAFPKFLPKSGLKLGYFQDSSRDRLAGTGVIQYAAASHVTPASVASFNSVHTFAVKCELSKKATSGGFKWTAQTPNATDYKLLDAYPNGSGFVVRLQLRPDQPPADGGPSTALNKPIAVYANCVKSRVQRGTPPV
ncbi:MAG: hypothetical protein ACRDKH_08700 [Solirubrobacterales bacterium]